ncbi:hypothetical protein SK803_28155 [Lentzea sp. BCCO 10_0856]|uniref:Uncharacterized protein n=1 Tax=Lentzea miocenica TaxID=3095431 RepID=A0ABU4T7H2_9PSEU|nr:hypothetical protein [Lentzea sp. BCCO 10_0856]MDX8034109.1 hypothetical protein [Lentzea sp. BCCO 10_0856]
MTEHRHTVLEGTRIRRTTNPDAGQVEAAVLTLARESSVVLSEYHDDNTYIQVWQRPDGLYQLEHRAGSPLEHFRTITVSADKVHAAFTAWLHEEDDWTGAFTWKTISELF